MGRNRQGQGATSYRPWATPTRHEARPEGHKTPKATADYTDRGTMREHCALCTMFIPPHGQNRWALCTEVAGKIMPGGWCRFFRKSQLHRE